MNRRKRETSAEKRLRVFLDKKKVKYAQHKRIEGMEVDFFFPQSNIVVEVDGIVHLMPKKMKTDERKTKKLMELGYKVLRFTNNEVFENPRKCVSDIINV